VDGALSVRLQQGLAAKSGVLAAQFAQIGFTGPTNILQGQFGFYPLYTRDEYDPQVITHELGRCYELNQTSLKPYPTCKFTHLPIAILAGMVKEHGITPEDISRITVHTNKDGYAKCASSPHKWRPRTVADVQFSIPITGAIAIRQGTVTLGDLTPATWNRSDIQALADRIEARVDPELEALPAMISPTIVELRTRAGASFCQREDFVSGSPEKPMSVDEVSGKFLGCVAASAVPISAERAQRFLQMAQEIESLADVRPMVDLLTGS
jgi:2-methylcitrate dehydratase PrpD